jgi:hypothetical protein
MDISKTIHPYEKNIATKKIKLFLTPFKISLEK